jgi:hypothetical protein
MAKFKYKSKSKWWGFGNHNKSIGFLNERNDDKNVVKVLKPEINFIPIHVTTGLYSPSTKELCGKRIEVVNLSEVQKYCQSEIFGKKGVHTSIVTDDGTLNVFETWEEIDKMAEKACNEYYDRLAAAMFKHSEKLVEALKKNAEADNGKKEC